MKRLLLGGCIFSFGLLQAQDDPRKDIDPSTLVDEVFSVQDLNINYQDLYENYLQLLSNPLDLNKVKDEQLQSLYLLDVAQIQSFLTYRKEAGPFLSVYELQNIPGFTKELFLKLAPFVTVEDPSKSFNKSIFKRIVEERNNYLLMRWAQTLEQQRGYSSQTDSASRYQGSPANLYARFRVSKPGDFSLGFTLEKDAGEVIRWDPVKKYYGFDYVSVHAQILNKGKIKNLIVGDYQAQFGQGIALGSVFGIGKNGEAVATVRRSNVGFSPYTSQYEAGYFRGAAVTYEVQRNLFLHALFSNRTRDGNIQSDTIQNTADVISSFSYTGLHRTPNELANRARIGKLTPDEIQGGTYTLTNVGSFGNVLGTPVINQPQVAIMAVGAIRKKPAVLETEYGDVIAIRHMMYLSHSYDHRVVDGALGGMFVRRVADYLEQWDVNREI